MAQLAQSVGKGRVQSTVRRRRQAGGARSARPPWVVALAVLAAAGVCSALVGLPAPVLGEPLEEDHPTDILQLARAVTLALSDTQASPPPSNSYSHETAYGPRRLEEPRIRLAGSEEASVYASTDCSGWISFLVNAVSPLHHAVLQSQRHRPEYNRDYGAGFVLEERRRAWARAFVLTNFFRAEYASVTGFQRLLSHDSVRSGDLVAYSLGRYIDPGDEQLPRPHDTGHAFVVAGEPTEIDPATPDYDGGGTLSARAVRVLAVPVIDSSSFPHFDPDTRKTSEGDYALPTPRPEGRVKPGGIGFGTAWLALDDDDRVIQRRLGPEGDFREVVISAVRLNNVISLVPGILDEEGRLVVDAFDNVPVDYAGVRYGEQPVSLTGEGGVRLVNGRLVLAGPSNFRGGVLVESGRLVVSYPTALGLGDLQVWGGSVYLRRPALPDASTLRLSSSVEEGAVHLDFRGQDIVHSLQIGDDLHRCGRWGAPESGATFTDARFSGPGVLRLTAEPASRCPAPAVEPTAASEQEEG